MKKILEKIQIFWKIWKSDEYFVMTSRTENRFGKYDPNGPIKYRYYTDTDRNFFFVFLRDWLNKKTNNTLNN